MNILIIEEALKSQHGHWFQYIRDMVGGGQEAGHRIDVIAHQDVCSEIKKSFNTHPVLKKTVWEDKAKTNGYFSRFINLYQHNQGLFDDLSKWLASHSEKYDLTIFPTVRLDHLWGINWLAKNHHSRLGKVVAIFAETPGSWSNGNRLVFSKSSLPLSLSMKWIDRNKHLIYATESSGLIHQYAAFYGGEMIYVPHTTAMPKDVTRRISSNSTLRFGLSGFTRYDKGLDLLHTALRKRLSGSQSDVEFLIQWTGDYDLPDGTKVTQDGDLASAKWFQYLPAFKTSEEYHRFLKDIDAVVLPYRKDFYRDKLSRVAIDAALVGLPMIYPLGTWLESFVEKYGSGIGFEPESTDSLYAAIHQLSTEYTYYAYLAMTRRESVKEDFSGRHFFELLQSHLCSANSQ